MPMMDDDDLQGEYRELLEDVLRNMLIARQRTRNALRNEFKTLARALRQCRCDDGRRATRIAEQMIALNALRRGASAPVLHRDMRLDEAIAALLGSSAVIMLARNGSR